MKLEALIEIEWRWETIFQVHFLVRSVSKSFLNYLTVCWASESRHKKIGFGRISAWDSQGFQTCSFVWFRSFEMHSRCSEPSEESKISTKTLLKGTLKDFNSIWSLAHRMLTFLPGSHGRGLPLDRNQTRTFWRSNWNLINLLDKVSPGALWPD